MEGTTIGAEMLLTLSGTRKNTLEASNFVSLVESFYFVFIYLFFFLSPSSSSFILHFSGKNELAKIAALVVDQSENRTCLSITHEPHAWAPQSTLRVRFLRDRGCLSFNSYPVSSLITCQNNACIILAWHGVLHGRDFWKLSIMPFTPDREKYWLYTQFVTCSLQIEIELWGQILLLSCVCWQKCRWEQSSSVSLISAHNNSSC